MKGKCGQKAVKVNWWRRGGGQWEESRDVEGEQRGQLHYGTRIPDSKRR